MAQATYVTNAVRAPITGASLKLPTNPVQASRAFMANPAAQPSLSIRLNLQAVEGTRGRMA
jgi:hypothetical protein